MVEDWGKDTLADPDIGPKIKEVKANIGRGYDALISAAGEKAPAMREAIAEFKSVMDISGVGNHKAFVKIINAFAAAVTEGKPVPGGKPSPFGQGQTGDRPSPAQALYGNKS